jgi:hypothetical protein
MDCSLDFSDTNPTDAECSRWASQKSRGTLGIGKDNLPLGALTPMTQDTGQRAYRGVKCLICFKPIAISVFMASVEADLRADETTPPRNQKSQKFNLRCVSCGKEKPYKISEILEFTAKPLAVSPRAERTSTNLYELENRS